MKDLVRVATISFILFGLPMVFNYFELVLPAVPRNTANSSFCFYLCVYAVDLSFGIFSSSDIC